MHCWSWIADPGEFMIKVITYGTYDLLHYGHIRLLERARALGDYLIVGVTSDDYDKTRGKINNQQTLMERIAAVKATGLADEVIVEEYEGQKIDDIQKYGVDIFTVGSDWEGKFDYLKEYCQVIYLDRTEGVSSSMIRSDEHRIRIGLIGNPDTELTSLAKFMREMPYVNGMDAAAIYGSRSFSGLKHFDNYDEFLDTVDAVYVASHPTKHFRQIETALRNHKHVLCESPIALKEEHYTKLTDLAEANHCVLMDAVKTAYTTAYERLLLILKSGKIGQVVSVDSTCTSLRDVENYSDRDVRENWNTITEWGPVALLPIFQILGTDYKDIRIVSKTLDSDRQFDIFTKINLEYDDAVASVRIGKGVKSEGEMIISGTKGYLIVPAPWWKTDYFEIRYENPAENRRYFYQLDGEGIRYEIVAFSRAITTGSRYSFINKDVSRAICSVMQKFYQGQVRYLGC